MLEFLLLGTTIALVSCWVPPLLEFPVGFSCQQTQDELALFLVLSVCVIDFLCHVERMADENKRDNAASLFEFGGAMNDWCDQAQSALP